jgi:NADPH-dependent ferric siderophore reductase
MHQDAFPMPPPTKVHEAVRVAVDFFGHKVTPLAFVWSGKKYVIDKVNLVYKRRDGQRELWCFAVSDRANSYVLLYDPEQLRWILEEVYTL